MLLVALNMSSEVIYKFLIFDAYHPDTIYLCQQGCEDPYLFSKYKRDPRRGMFGKHSYKHSICSISKGSNYSSGLSFAAIDAAES
jgi:hypothetical protein